MSIAHDLSKGRILVTGGAGFIGSALVWALNQRGLENILVADFLGQDEKWKNLTPLRFGDYIEADELADRVEDECPSLSNLKTVFHLGACSSTTETNAAYLIDNNYNYTKLLADWSLRHGARFVYASSAATYGDGTRGMDDSDESKLARLRPLNMYGYSKHLFDLHAKRRKLLPRITGLKYFNVFGPNESHKGDMRSLVHKAYGQIVETGRVQLFKSYRPEYRDGEQQRDFLYVKDAVAMTLALAENPAATGLFNIGSGVASTWLQLTDAIFRALGQAPKVEFIDMPEVLREKYQYFTQADVAKWREAAPAAASVRPLAEGVGDYVRNYLKTGQYLGDETVME
jgi:ADP-L-glycero-D-manno-heptose 6-epimerase